MTGRHVVHLNFKRTTVYWSEINETLHFLWCLEKLEDVVKSNIISDSRINYIDINNNIKYVDFNARSIVHKLSEPELMIRDENIDILEIGELSLFEDISDYQISCNGFGLDRKNLVV